MTLYSEKSLPALTMGYMIAATELLNELVKDRGEGPWLDELQERIRENMRYSLPDTLNAEQGAEVIKAGIFAIDGIFDR